MQQQTIANENIEIFLDAPFTRHKAIIFAKSRGKARSFDNFTYEMNLRHPVRRAPQAILELFSQLLVGIDGLFANVARAIDGNWWAHIMLLWIMA